MAQAWKKPLAGGDVAVLLLNAGDSGNQDVRGAAAHTPGVLLTCAAELCGGDL